MGDRFIGNSRLCELSGRVSMTGKVYFSLKFLDNKKLLKLNPVISLLGLDRNRMLMFLFTKMESSIEDTLTSLFDSINLREFFFMVETPLVAIVVLSASVSYYHNRKFKCCIVIDFGFKKENFII